MDKNKKIIIGIIFAITAILAVVSLYISYELRKDLSPDLSEADVKPTVTVTKREEVTTQDVPLPTKVIPTKIRPTKVLPTSIPTPTDLLPTETPPVENEQENGLVPPLNEPLPSKPLPSTALINDRVDTLFMGLFLIFIGVFLYRKYLNFGTKKV